ncbi:hypothetical protein OESDEN_17817 [Oesophagostomum dentatum]|uniref:Uncharacterized protein n=1 Tax=Oesophagostomum dentatum TaxID=61180 RepID=A0A0B1SC42_OESDE|nr:hypothetical protein OESDEN_17817 [Oesophagostomum dentatum]
MCQLLHHASRARKDHLDLLDLLASLEMQDNQDRLDNKEVRPLQESQEQKDHRGRLEMKDRLEFQAHLEKMHSPKHLEPQRTSGERSAS